MIQSNFFACLRTEEGLIVPGSARHGHNVLTNFGREWFAQLMVWQTITTTDVPYTNDRVRWIGVGSDKHPEVKSVERLKQPVTITIGPNVYLTPVDDPPTFPAANWVQFSRTFSTSEISHTGAVTLKEAGLYVDEDSGGGPGLNTGIGTNQIVAYKTFDGLVKFSGFTLEIKWDFRF